MIPIKQKNAPVQKTEIPKQAAQPNHTGIPTPTKSLFEARSGLSFDDVRVHYNSQKPARLQALAYTQGNQVYVAPGQERHLPHELGHVVQQKQGLVTATRTINHLPVNDSARLESDAERGSFAHTSSVGGVG